MTHKSVSCHCMIKRNGQADGECKLMSQNAEPLKLEPSHSNQSETKPNQRRQSNMSLLHESVARAIVHYKRLPNFLQDSVSLFITDVQNLEEHCFADRYVPDIVNNR